MGFRSGELASHTSNVMVRKPVTISFGPVGRCQVLLEKEICIYTVFDFHEM